MLAKILLRFSLFCIVLTVLYSQHEFDSAFDRPINGDAKGYYAYLPALFIYGDFSYSFVDSMEKKYYPPDGSLAKNFRVKQANGSVVNKCFPGTAIFYLPFFAFAALLSFMLNYPMDGYSVLFQVAIPFAHVFYVLLGSYLFNLFLKSRGVSWDKRWIAILLVLFATNLYFYFIYDFTVAHVFGYFGVCTLLYLVEKYRKQAKTIHLSLASSLVALLLITRPTNAMILLFIPLVFSWKELTVFFSWRFYFQKKHVLTLLFPLLILSIAPILWKIQTGNFLVYSYGEEKLNLLNPHLIDFLFSFKKGWFLWSPFVLLAFILGTIAFYRIEKWKAFVFFFGIMLVAYVFSSWWIWTFGMGMGQRPMIEFYPILFWGFAEFLEKSKHTKWVFLTLLFIPLTTIQAYQIQHYILVGGATTKESYLSHFLQLKKDPPSVQIEADWIKIEEKKLKQVAELSESNLFSATLEFNQIDSTSILIVEVVAGGKNNKTDAQLVVSDSTGALFLNKYITGDLYQTPRKLRYRFDIETDRFSTIKTYLWNGNPSYTVKFEQITVAHYKRK